MCKNDTPTAAYTRPRLALGLIVDDGFAGRCVPPPGGCKKSRPPKKAAETAVTDEVLGELGARLEKDTLKLGFIKLTDCAPLVIAKEKGYFEDEGLNVELEAQANWKVLLDRVISGEWMAHMLAGQPIGATIGFGTKAHVVTRVQHGPEWQRHHRLERSVEADAEERQEAELAHAAASHFG